MDRIIFHVLLGILIPFNVLCNSPEIEPKVGDICHVEAEKFYPGVWELYSSDELICNYWQFLDIDEPEFDTEADTGESEAFSDTEPTFRFCDAEDEQCAE